MNSLKYVGKCIGKACGLQTSEFSDIYEDLKEASTLGPNTQTRKNKLSKVNTKLQTLARTRSKKTNLAKVSTLRLAHNILNAQRSNAVFESANFKKRIKSLKNRKNKHETEQLVEQLILEEIKPIYQRYNNAMKPVRKLQEEFEIQDYIKDLQTKEQEKKNKQSAEVKKTAEVILKKFPMFDIKNPRDEQFIRSLIEHRLMALVGEMTTEDEVARDPKKAAAVEKLFTERVSNEMEAKNKTYGVRTPYMPLPSTSTIPVVSQQQQNTKKGRKSRKMNRRR